MTEFLDAVELQTGPQPTWSVLWLHGLGADGNDFAPIVPELVRRDWPAMERQTRITGRTPTAPITRLGAAAWVSRSSEGPRAEAPVTTQETQEGGSRPSRRLPPS
mgnify:CR=1 FL=1